MKKLIAIGIITVLTFNLAGCSWFQSPEPTVEKPIVTEPYKYKNTKYGFALTFPANWGEVKEVEQEIDNRIDIIITSEDKSKDITLYIFEKQLLPITASLDSVGITDKFVIGYQGKYLDIYNLEKEGKDASKEKALQKELESIVATFTSL